MSAPDEVYAAIEAGFSVVPADMDKRPKVRWKDWQTERQTEAEIAGLGHGSIWGLVTGALYGVTVLDFDFDAGGEETLATLGFEPHVKTPGGAHVYVKHPGHPVKNSARSFEQYPGLDIRGDGGLAWFAGRSKKGKYEPVIWPPAPENLVTLFPEEQALFFPHPQEATARAPRSVYTGSGLGVPEAVRYLNRLADDIRGAERGTSNKVLNKAAYSVGGLVAAGQLDEEHAFEILLAAAEERGAGEPSTVIGAGFETGRDAPWSMDVHEDDEWIPAIALKVFGSQGGVPEPVPFPIDAFPAPLDDLIRKGAEAVSSPPDYFGVCLLPALGVGIGGYVDLAITESWRESAVIYGAMVGLPGARKTPPLKIVMAPIWDAEKKMYEASREVDDEKYLDTDPPQIVVDDATIEALYQVIEQNPRGVLMRADELIGWVKGMGQYKGGAGRDRQTWLSMWSRDTVKVNRKTSANHRIDKPFVSVIGGLQPEILEEMIHAKEDGLLPRLLLAGGEYITPVLRRGVLDPSLTDRYARLWSDLRDEGTMPRTVEFTPAGYTAFETWVNEHYKAMGRMPAELRGAWAKMDAQAARISLILAMTMGTEVTPDVVDRAVSLVRYFQGQAAGLLRGAGSGSRWEKQWASRAKALARYIIDNPGVGRPEIMGEFEWAMDARTLDRMLEPLADAGIWHG